MEELETWLAALLATPSRSDPEAFNAALSLIPYLEEKDALSALRSRLVSLEMESAGSTARMEGLRPMLPRLLMLEEAHRIAMVRAERDYTAALIGELEAGTISWDREALRRMARDGRRRRRPGAAARGHGHGLIGSSRRGARMAQHSRSSRR